jgi:hypothetical protein
MALATYYPEMNQAKPAAAFEASMSCYGGGYRVQTRRTLKGRGITFIRTLKSSDLVPQAQAKVGCHEYKLTALAFQALCKAEAVSMETLL